MIDDSLGGQSDKPQRGRKPDPGRRDRIIDAALQVIASQGVAGTTHRKVAAVAKVPLGSMTYYFSGMSELLREAFTRFAERSADTFDNHMRSAESINDAIDTVQSFIVKGQSSEDTVITYELYTLAARDHDYQDITEAWMTRSRRTLECHFDPLTARLLDALIEGIGIHRALDRDPMSAKAVVTGMRRIIGGR
jgi:DNA-binding transcriptional regulator YbjK